MLNNRTLMDACLAEAGLDTATLFSRRVEMTPDNAFLHWNDRTWSYREAWEEIVQRAALLRDVVGASGRVASYLGNGPEAVWTWFAAHLAGLVYVPLNRSHRGELLKTLVDRAGAGVVVTERSGLESLAGYSEAIVLVDPPSGRSDFGTISIHESYGRSLTERPNVRPCDLATVMFTSGTTGRSKAVCIPHKMLVRGAARVADAFGFTRSDVFHVWMPLFHVAAQIHQVTSMIVVGGSVAMFPTFSRSGFWSEVHKTKSTLFCGLPNIIELLWSLPKNAEDHNNTLRLGLIGGPPIAIQHAFEERFGLSLYDTYGMTEAEPLTLPRKDLPTPLGSCGAANPDFEFRIVDENGLEVPDGRQGELLVRPNLMSIMMQGYEGDAEVTVASWRDLWWRTGDLVSRDTEGFLFVHGRLKQMIRRRGENISAWELESLIADHDAVAECAVVGVPSPFGEEDVKAVVVLEPGFELTPAQLHDFCLGRMARFMVPRYIEIVANLPRNDVGKVDKLALQTLHENLWDAEVEAPDKRRMV